MDKFCVYRKHTLFYLALKIRGIKMRLLTNVKICLIASLFTLSSITGQEEQCAIKEEEKTRSVYEQPQMTPGYNTSSRIDVCKNRDFFATGSFIYWQPIQEMMHLGVVSDNTNSLDFVNGHVVELDFKYKPGFKIGIGMNFDYDKWDTHLQYTWLRGSHHVHTSLDSSNIHVTLLPAWQIPDFLDPRYTFGSEEWKLHLDILEWSLARGYYVGEKLCFRPFFGARAAWIRQNLHVDYTNVIPSFLLIWPSTHISQNFNSWGVGPTAGVCTNWNIGHGCRLYGNGEIDILYTQYTHLKARQISDASGATHVTIRRKDANYLRTHLELTFGFGWGTYFANNKWHADLSADYGYQVFFDQNMFQFPQNAFAIGRLIAPNGNLYIHGLTTSLRVDF